MKDNFNLTINIFGREVTVTLATEDKFNELAKDLGYSDDIIPGLYGSTQPNNTMLLALCEGYTNCSLNETSKVFMFDDIEQNLWHEIGHVLDRIRACVPSGERTSLTCEYCFMLQKTVNDFMDAVKKEVSTWN